MVDVEGMNVTSEYIKTLKIKRAQIRSVEGYKEFTDDDGNSKKKLCIKVELETNEVMDYIPNKTSIKTLSRMFGTKNIEITWKDKLFQWIIATTMYQGKKTDVLYIDDVDLNKVVEIKV